MKAPKSIGLHPDIWVLVLQTMLGYQSESAEDVAMADDFVTRIAGNGVTPGVEGFHLNIHTGAIGFSMAYCEECGRNVGADSKNRAGNAKLRAGECPVCGGEVSDPCEVFIEISKRERIFLWDAMKKHLKGKRTPLLTRKLALIAAELGKSDEFQVLTAPSVMAATEIEEPEHAGEAATT